MANVDEIIEAALTSGDIYSITERLKAEVSIGSEFTFDIGGRKFSMEDLCIKGVSEDISQKIREHADVVIKSINKGGNGSCEEKKKEEKEEKWKGFQPIELEIYNKKTRTLFWIRYDVDPNCMELQMQPMTFETYSQNYPFLQEIVFDIAASNGFIPVPNETGGGGHISFSRNMFNNDVRTLIKFIILYSLEVREGSLDEFNNLRGCKDEDNAPILTMEQMQKLKASLNPEILDPKISDSAIQNLEILNPKELTPAILDAKKSGVVDEFVEFMNNTIYMKLSKNVINQYISIDKGKRVNENDLIRELGRHYQAINLEHMTDKVQDLSRIEMRRFNAQEKLYDFLNQVDSLYGLYAVAKIIPIADVLALIH